MTRCADFLDYEHFEGRVRRADAAAASVASQASFHGFAIVTSWSRAEAAALLPDELVLAPNTSDTPELHPVVFLFGDQRGGAAVYGGFTFPTAVVYQEFTLALPFVRHRDGDRLLIHVPRMVCSFPPAMWVGNAAYGFEKRLGSMGFEGPIYAVRDAGGALLCHAHFETGVPRATAVARDFDAFRALFDQPVTGRRTDGRFVSSLWRFDCNDARIRPADALVTIDAPFAAGIRPGEHPDVEGGSFAVEGMVWRLSWPRACGF